MNTTQDIPEADLARSLGVSRDDLKKLRALLRRDVHWHGSDGRPIMITPSGVLELSALFEAQKKGATAELQQAASVAQTGACYTTLVVVRIGSPRVILAKKDGDPDSVPLADLIRLQVRTSLHFMPGMKLDRCAPSPHHPGVAYYHGRYPRRKGKF